MPANHHRREWSGKKKVGGRHLLTSPMLDLEIKERLKLIRCKVQSDYSAENELNGACNNNVTRKLNIIFYIIY